MIDEGYSIANFEGLGLGEYYAMQQGLFFKFFSTKGPILFISTIFIISILIY